MSEAFASSSSNSDYNGLGAALLAGEQELVNPKEAKRRSGTGKTFFWPLFRGKRTIIIRLATY